MTKISQIASSYSYALSDHDRDEVAEIINNGISERGDDTPKGILWIALDQLFQRLSKKKAEQQPFNDAMQALHAFHDIWRFYQRAKEREAPNTEDFLIWSAGQGMNVGYYLESFVREAAETYERLNKEREL